MARSTPNCAYQSMPWKKTMFQVIVIQYASVQLFLRIHLCSGNSSYGIADQHAEVCVRHLEVLLWVWGEGEVSFKVSKGNLVIVGSARVMKQGFGFWWVGGNISKEVFCTCYMGHPKGVRAWWYWTYVRPQRCALRWEWRSLIHILSIQVTMVAFSH